MGGCYSFISKKHNSNVKNTNIAVVSASSDISSMPTLLPLAQSAEGRNTKSVFVSSHTVDLTEYGRGTAVQLIPCDTLRNDVSCDTLRTSLPYGDLFTPSLATQKASTLVPTHTVDLTGEGRGVPYAQLPCDTVTSSAPNDTTRFKFPFDTFTACSVDSIAIDLTGGRSDATLVMDLTSVRSGWATSGDPIQ